MASPIVVAATPGRKRKCPQCGHQQKVAVFLHAQPVRCHRCAAPIPPTPRRAKTPDRP